MTEEKKAGFKRTRYTQGQVLRNPEEQAGQFPTD
jgi:ubiquitin